ncbi:467_t:CDS:1, partial [Funneliformis geosporum]
MFIKTPQTDDITVKPTSSTGLIEKKVQKPWMLTHQPLTTAKGKQKEENLSVKQTNKTFDNDKAYNEYR